MQSPQYIRLPDLFALTPVEWQRPNPHFRGDFRPSTEWMLSYGFFAGPKRSRIDAANAELLGAYTYTYVDAELLRVVSDYLTMLFTLDEITDEQDGEGAMLTRERYVRALLDESGEDDSPVTRFTKDFMKRLPKASKNVLERFIATNASYIEATANEARLRAHGEVMSIEEYIPHRRENGGVRPCFDLIELVLGVELPEEVLKDHDFINAQNAAIDMIGWANDVYSYAIEYARGIEGNNSVTVLMESKGLTVQEAMDHVALIYKDFGEILTDSRSRIRSFGPEVDKAVQTYIMGMEQWVIGNLEWSLDTGRFFGKEVRETRMVELKPHKSVV